jgi:hypothetical protein
MEQNDQIKGLWRYAWHGSGRKWDAAWLQVAGGVLGGFAIWYWGLKVPSEILDNPAFSGIAAIVIGAICGALVAFVLRLCWYPVYRRCHSYGGLVPYLRAKLGVQMWPIVLMASGFFFFVVLSGGGLIWLIVQTVKVTPARTAANLDTAAAPLTAPEAPNLENVQLIYSRTAALSPKDKEELSGIFRSMSETFNETDKLTENLSQIGREMKAEMGPENIQVAKHTADLKQLSEMASVEKKKLQNYFHDQYFDQQINYVMGYDPHKAGIAQAQLESFGNFLQSLSTIKNNDAHFAGLLEPALTRFLDGMDKFRSWTGGCRSRLAQLKQLVT